MKTDVHKLDRLFKPQRIALIGITSNPNSVGGKVLANLVEGGFRGVVYPVNPEQEAVLGIQCYPDVHQLPKTPDLGILCAPAPAVPELVRQCGKAGILGIIILSAGFKESGSEGRKLEEQVRALASEFDGMRIIGPNCLGIIVPDHNLNASFASGMPKKGRIAFLSQSGALCTSVLDWAAEEGVGFSYFISVGNMLDVDFGDLIDYVGEDENTHSIVLYIESIEDARKFMTAARAFARTKPIIAYKAGRFPQSAQAAVSHTGALAAEDAVYGAAFRRAGVTRVYDIGEIFAVTELFGRHKLPRGPRLGIITNAGGPGVMALDSLYAAKGELADLSPETLTFLNENLPAMWSGTNPVDVLGDARSKRIMKAVKTVMQDPKVDAGLVILTPQAMTNPTTTARAIAEFAQTLHKPLLAAWLGGKRMQEGRRLLAKAQIPAYTTPEQAVRAFMTLVEYSRNLERLYQTPRDITVDFSLDREKIRQRFASMTAGKKLVFSEQATKQLLAAYGIPVTETLAAEDEQTAVQISAKLGYPVDLKILSPDISRKTEVDGVILGIKNEQMVRAAFRQLFARAQELRPQADIKGVTVQPMIQEPEGVELILGTKRDPVFGTVILVGSGGITAEIYGDVAIGFPPLNEKLALMLLQEIRIWPLLQGYRGRPPLALNPLIETLIRLSYLAVDFPEITELDINPLIVGKSRVMALDARMRIDPELQGKTLKAYSHLALRPYPEEFIHDSALKDGSSVRLRPIKPEDEPLWFELLGSCSKESIYSRFRYFFHWDSHEVATRYCYIDYDREIAIVAEQEQEGRRRLLGVGRLVGDPGLETAEYAVLVGDAWQSQGLGSILTDYCIEIAGEWGVKSLLAVTTSDNKRMLQVFRKRGFELDFDKITSLVHVRKTMI